MALDIWLLLQHHAMPFRIILHLMLINAPVDLIILIFPVHTWDKSEITICIDFGGDS